MAAKSKHREARVNGQGPAQGEALGGLRTALEEERATVLVRLTAATTGADALREARGASDGDDEHDPEGSTVAWDLATQQASVEAARRHLEDVDAALARLDTGWDGACAGCGRPIPAARLAVRPSAERCVECAARA